MRVSVGKGLGAKVAVGSGRGAQLLNSAAIQIAVSVMNVFVCIFLPSNSLSSIRYNATHPNAPNFGLL